MFSDPSGYFAQYNSDRSFINRLYLPNGGIRIITHRHIMNKYSIYSIYTTGQIIYLTNSQIDSYLVLIAVPTLKEVLKYALIYGGKEAIKYFSNKYSKHLLQKLNPLLKAAIPITIALRILSDLEKAQRTDLLQSIRDSGSGAMIYRLYISPNRSSVIFNPYIIKKWNGPWAYLP